MRKWLSIFSAIIILVVVLIIAALWQVNRTLKASHIENVHYQIESLGFRRLQFSELSFVYNAGKIPQTVQLRNLHAEWKWQNFLPHFDVIEVDQLIMTGSIHPAEVSENQPITKSSAAFTLPQDWRVPEIFPKQIHLKEWVLNQPCATGVCRLIAKLDVLSPTQEQATFKLIASPGNILDAEHQLQVNAIYKLDKNLPALDANIAIDKNINVQVSTHLLKKNELYWLGKLTGSGNYLDSWWAPYLTAWNIKNSLQTHQLNESEKAEISLKSDWQLALTPLLNLPATADATQYSKAINGRWFLDAQIPLPLKILDFGEFAGQTKIDIELVAGQLSRYSISADINAAQLNLPDVWQNYGLVLDRVHLNLQSKVEDGASLASLPVEFSGDTQGGLVSKFSGHILADALAKKIVVDRFNIETKANQLKPYADYEFKNINLNLQAIGYWQPDSFSFSLNKTGQVSTDINAKSLTLTAKNARLTANQLNIAGKINQGNIVWPELNIESDLVVKVDKLSHAQFKENTWQWKGKTTGIVSDFDVKGELAVGSALNAIHHVRLKNSELTLEWKLRDIFLLAANPFADTLNVWPSLLSLARGKLNAQGNLEFNIDNNSLTKSDTRIQLQDIAGIYDTTIFEGLNTQANISTIDKTFKITADELKVNQLNKGFLLGPLQASGAYLANWSNPLKGKLALKYFNGAVVDGSVSTPAQTFDFNKPVQNLVLALKQINLTSILQQHPSSELSGSGQLSGNIPIEISAKGIRISKGAVAAEPPGGKLKYQSARAAELAKSQPSMKLLTEALSDFQYSVLASEVNYDETGRLNLAIRLEGKNPKLEKGRPINFNINFEEDIPAMLASIQLSSKVNDIVKKRLQEYLQKKPDATTVSIKK